MPSSQSTASAEDDAAVSLDADTPVGADGASDLSSSDSADASVAPASLTSTQLAPQSLAAPAAAPRASWGWYSFKATPQINNADVAYAYFTGAGGQNATLTPVNGNVSIDQFKSMWSWEDAYSAYVVFFVKPSDGYLLTGLGASGEGDLYSLESVINGQGAIAGYPGIKELCERAQQQGYVAAFGYSEVDGGNLGDVNVSFTVDGYKPSVNLYAQVTPSSDVTPGTDLTCTFTLSAATHSDSGQPLTITDMGITSLTVNGTSVEAPDLTPLGNGSYQGTFTYTATPEDCEKDELVIEAATSTDYQFSFSGDDSTITSTTTVTNTASSTCSIAAKKGLGFRYLGTTVEGTHPSLPKGVTATMPEPIEEFQGTMVELPAPSETKVEDASQNGYWTFEGWRIGDVTYQPGSQWNVQDDYTEAVGLWMLHRYTSISDASQITVSQIADTPYNGSDQKLEPQVATTDGTPLSSENGDYAIKWSGDTCNATSQGVTVTITGNKEKGYSGTVTRTYRITPKELTATIGDLQKEYDGTADVLEDPQVTLDGVVEGDNASASISKDAVSFATEAVHENQPLKAEATDVQLAGDDAGNYSVTSVSGNGTITEKQDPNPDPDQPTTPGTDPDNPGGTDPDEPDNPGTDPDNPNNPDNPGSDVDNPQGGDGSETGTGQGSGTGDGSDEGDGSGSGANGSEGANGSGSNASNSNDGKDTANTASIKKLAQTGDGAAVLPVAAGALACAGVCIAAGAKMHRTRKEQ